MKRSKFSLRLMAAVVALAGLGVAATAYAGYRTPGTRCVALSSSFTPMYDTVKTNAGMFFSCPVVSNSGTLLRSASSATLHYLDASTVAGDGISCTMNARNRSDTLYISSGLKSCSTAGGCAQSAGNNTFSGAGYLTFSGPFLSYAEDSTVSAYYFVCNALNAGHEIRGTDTTF